MNKKEYIENLSRLIKNRVIFHAPKNLQEIVDFQLLDVVGIDKNLPIFKFSKPMTKVLLQAFVKAQKEVKFNLVLQEDFIKKSWLKKLKNVYLFDENNSSYSLKKLIDEMNINYLSHSNFLPSLTEQFLKINDQKIDLDFCEFYRHKKCISGGVIFDVKEFVLNGKNVALCFSNPHEEAKSISFEFNLPLPRGYYHFSKVKTGVKITNLTTGEIAFFNYDVREGEVNFSCVDGLENSTRACVNLRIVSSLKPHVSRRFFFSFGKSAYFFSNPRDVDRFFELSQEKANALFDVKISSADKNFDNKFNHDLPQKIWQAWADFACDEESEKEYLTLKDSIVKTLEKGYIISDKIKGLKQVKIFSDGQFRHVFIVQGEQKFVMAQKTKFFNFSLVSKEFFKQTSEIYLCFGR